jgi:hypothetical protein
MLRAIEEEHFDQLPGGVFNKGFVRAYARQVGLYEEEAIADYLAALRESQIRQQSILPDFRNSAGRPDATTPPSLPGNGQHPIAAPQPQGRDKDRREEDRRNKKNNNKNEDRHLLQPNLHLAATIPSADLPAQPSPAQPSGQSPAHTANKAAASGQIPWTKLAAALLLVALILAFWNLRRHAVPNAASQPAGSAQPQSSAPAPVPISTPAPNAPAPSTNSLIAAKPSTASTLTSGTISPGPISSAASSTKPAPTLPTPTPSSFQPTPPAATPANPPLPKSKSPAPEPKPPATFTVLIRAEKTTWISIVADGKPVAEETLIAPAHTSVRASHEVYVRAGNAAGVTFQLNGKDIPVQGNEGEVKAYIFDSTGLRTQ